MRAILNNPYRIVGLLIGATAPEQRRQLTRLQRYIEAEQEPEGDYSFPILGKMERTIDQVNDAASKLNLDSDKMNAAIFWFYKGNSIIDEPALEAIRDGDVSQAFNVWSKLTMNGEVTQRSASAFGNLGTLCLSGALTTILTKEKALEQGISLKLKFLESEFVRDVQALATDETYKITKKELQLVFLNQVQAELVNTGIFATNKFLEILNRQFFAAREDFLKGFVQKPIEQIEKQIAECKLKRKDKAVAITAGKTLYQQTIEGLTQLKSILGASNPKYTSISDKVSDEVLQCGIEHYNLYKDSTTIDPGPPAMELFIKAKSLAIGNIAVQRCQENTANLQKWIDDKPERDKIARVKDDFEALKRLIDDSETQRDTVANAKNLLASARPYLTRVKNVLGAYEELYLGVSTRIAADAQGMCIAEINGLQDQVPAQVDHIKRLQLILVITHEVNEALTVMNSILAMDLRADFRERAVQNKTSLSRIQQQLAPTTGGGNSGGGNGGGCYIATMAYGDYDHPQVWELRKFRDEVLARSIAGRLFIRSYYFISPKLVALLKDQAAVNTFIRKLLNQFIKLRK
jgi:hypothetical protein